MNAQSHDTDEQATPPHGDEMEQHSGHGSESVLIRLHSQEKARADSEPREAGHAEVTR
jgi:hypothetical protein